MPTQPEATFCRRCPMPADVRAALLGVIAGHGAAGAISLRPLVRAQESRFGGWALERGPGAGQATAGRARLSTQAP